MKDKESVEISCLPMGWTYTVEEADPGTNFKVSYSINGGSKTVGEAASFTMAATGTEDIQFTNTSTVAPPVTGRNIQNNSWIMMLIVVLLIGIGSMVFFRKVKRKYH
ncbi:LPXTG cell wall anchor domain-containing protein [Firmicutes bacterium OM07-11]|nr:LPXTG cell wall anchor domain-containing protein [Firmicutes bacterium OM07-11]